MQLLSRLRHPNIIGYEDAFVADGDLCLVMEYAGGGTLEGSLRRARETSTLLDEAWVLDCLLQLCSGVNYLHACRVLHRDIKPANILLAGEGRVPKLADFGISMPMLADERQLGRHLPGGSAEGEVLPSELRSRSLEGTPLYLAPELFVRSLQARPPLPALPRLARLAECAAASRRSTLRSTRAPPTCGRSASASSRWWRCTGRTKAPPCTPSRTTSAATPTTPQLPFSSQWR